MTTITEDYVSFETAKLLKEKGFDELTTKSYPYFEGKDYKYDISCPTLQMAMKWLRKAHNICVVSFPVVTDDDGEAGCLWNYVISRKLKTLHNSDALYESSESALSNGLKYTLENLI